MMNKNQYFRLCLVLVTPLLATGWWLAEKNIIFDTHVIQCQENYRSKEYYCYSFEKNKQNRIKDPNLFLWNKAILIGGFHEKVSMQGIIEVEYNNGEEKEKIIGSGERIINVGTNNNGNFYTEELCTLYPVSDQNGSFITGEAALVCSNQNFGKFSFLDKEAAEKYMTLFVRAEEESKKISRQEKYTYVIALLIPLLLFISASGVVLLLNMTILFIKHGHDK